MAYVLQLDALERRVAVAQTLAGYARAQGGDVGIPDFDVERAAWEAWLCEPPEEGPDGGDPGQATLRRALGLRG